MKVGKIFGKCTKKFTLVNIWKIYVWKNCPKSENVEKCSKDVFSILKNICIYIWKMLENDWKIGVRNIVGKILVLYLL